MSAIGRTLATVWCILISFMANAWDFWPLPMAEEDNQKDSILYIASVSALASYGGSAPFLMHTNSDGDISTAPFSGNLSIGILKPSTRPSRWYDYDFGVVVNARVNSPLNTEVSPLNPRAGVWFSNLYAHARLYIVDITAGIKPQTYGNSNPELSSGSLIFSRNAHALPRISIGIDRYTAFPGLYGYLAVKGGISHAWLNDNNPHVKGAMVHHKFIGFRIGGRLPVNVSYEFHHVSQWGGYSAKHGDLGNDFHSFMDAFLIRSGGRLKTDQDNAHGNHIGFQELALHLNVKQVSASVYWQALFEDKSAAFIGAGMNATDGLWGLNIRQEQWPFIEALTVEVLNTTSQSGPVHDKDGLIYAGRDGYYHNSVYPEGWTYFTRVIGNPFIDPYNNRVRMVYAGISGDIYAFRYRLAAAYAHRFGTYATPEESRSTSLLLDVSRTVPQAWGLEFGIRLSADIDSNPNPLPPCSEHTVSTPNTFGAMIYIRKTGLIWKN